MVRRDGNRLGHPLTAPIRWLSEWLAPVQEILLRHGYRRSHLGGSSAREILDHLWFDAPVALRDLDVYVLKHATVRPADVDVLRDDLSALGSVGPLREKRRANPALTGPSRYTHVAGVGMHLRSRDRPILSLGVLNHPADLALNGLFDMDTVLLPFDNDQPFHLYAARVARDRGPVLDPHHGYQAWRARSPRIVHWAEVERCHARNAFRIVRSLGKTSQQHLPRDLADAYRRRRPATPFVDDPLELHRDFLKVLGDPHCAEELAMLAELNALALISPSMQAKISAATPDLPSPPGTTGAELARLRAQALCDDTTLLATLLAIIPLVYGAP